MAEYRFELFADYSQFYLQDESQEELCFDWTPEELKHKVALTHNTIGVSTARNMYVPVVIKLCETAPVEDLGKWDKVYECSIDLPSGRLVVAGCTDYLPDAARIEVLPGAYRARVYHGALATLRDNGLAGDDHYQVVLWPSPLAAPKTLK